MTWHELPDLPEPNVEVLAEITTPRKEIVHRVLIFRKAGCFFMPTDFQGWETATVDISNVKRWAYIH